MLSRTPSILQIFGRLTPSSAIVDAFQISIRDLRIYPLGRVASSNGEALTERRFRVRSSWPANFKEGKQYPVIVEVYGGDDLSEGVFRFGFGPGVFNLQLLATRGYAVLLPNTPIHTGTPMLDLLKTVMPVSIASSV